jgi:hypothetical protein
MINYYVTRFLGHPSRYGLSGMILFKLIYDFYTKWTKKYIRYKQSESDKTGLMLTSNFKIFWFSFLSFSTGVLILARQALYYLSYAPALLLVYLFVWDRVLSLSVCWLASCLRLKWLGLHTCTITPGSFYSMSSPLGWSLSGGRDKQWKRVRTP